MKKISLLAITILVATCSATAPSIPELRLTPKEITSGDQGESQIGSSKLAGVHTRILAGNPAAVGFYSILLFVPPRTTIQAHSHRDDRMATVVSGMWHFGYGAHFDERVLKTLPVGSVYSEPGGVNHFARTAELPVVVQISGFGPTDTRYFNPVDDPENQKKSE
ncbi:MAG: cupin domain-containing protein [Candidatus Sulfotelmatobacter sp.]